MQRSAPGPATDRPRPPAAPARSAAAGVMPGRQRTLPTRAATPGNAGPDGAWPGAAARDPQSQARWGWRDEARLLAAVVGAITLNVVPAAWVVAGQPTLDFAMFALMIAVTWAMCTALQLAALRWARARHSWARASPAAQVGAVAAVGAAFSLAFSSPLNPYERSIHVVSVDAWGSGVYAAWTSVLVAVFLVWYREGRQRQAEASQRLRSVQGAQLVARRALVESQLQAVQARIDPQHFFDTLDAIEMLYRGDVPTAEALFDELIVFLRAALPSLDSAASMLAREFDLAAACVRMHALATGVDIALDIDAERALLRLAFPPGLLLPLLRGILRAETATAEPGRRHITLAARVETGPRVLALSITAGAGPDEATLQQARATLRSLFGTAASLARTPPRDHRVTTHLRTHLHTDHDEHP